MVHAFARERKRLSSSRVLATMTTFFRFSCLPPYSRAERERVEYIIQKIQPPAHAAPLPKIVHVLAVLPAIDPTVTTEVRAYARFTSSLRYDYNHRIGDVLLLSASRRSYQGQQPPGEMPRKLGARWYGYGCGLLVVRLGVCLLVHTLCRIFFKTSRAIH